MSKEKYKLHPISAVINFVKALKEMLLPLVVLVLANGFGGNGSLWTNLLTYGIYAVALLLLLASGFVQWKRFRYWFEEGELRIEYGLFVKKKRYIPFERIQSLNYTEGIFHRPFGLVKVKVETAGGGPTKEAEAELTAISKAAAEQIKKEMLAAKAKDFSPEIGDLPEETIELREEKAPLYTMSTKDLIVLASTSGGIGVFFSGLAVLISQLSDIIPYEEIYNEIVVFIRFGVLMVALAILAVVFVAWVASVLLTFINYYQFAIRLEDEEIIITRGLLEKKKMTIPLSRIQAVRIVESPLRQMFGYAAVNVDSAGGSNADKDETMKLLPLIKRTEVNHILETIFPDLSLNPKFTVIPERSKKFFYRLDFLWIIPIVGVTTYFFFPYGLLTLVLIPLSFFLGMWQHRTAGFYLNDLQLVARYRVFSRVTVWMEKKRVQSMTQKTTYFQKRNKVSTIQTSIKSGGGSSVAVIPHLEIEDAETILEWYEPKRNHMEK